MKYNAAKRKNEGSTLVVALIVLTMVVVVVGAATQLSMKTAKSAMRFSQMEVARALGDAYLENAFVQWKTMMNGGPTNQTYVAPFYPNSPGIPSSLSGYTYSNGVVRYARPDFTPYPDSAATWMVTPPFAAQQNSAALTYYFLASVDVSCPVVTGGSAVATAAKPIVIHASRVFQKQQTNIWQYAIFFQNELEIHPSPVFTVNGLVHSNNAIYSCPDGGNPLTFEDMVTASTQGMAYEAPGQGTCPVPSGTSAIDGTGQWCFDGYDPNDVRSKPQNENPAAGFAGEPNTFTTGLTPQYRPLQPPFGISPSVLSSTNPNAKDYEQLIEPAASTSSPDPFASSRFATHAGLVVNIGPNNNSLTITGVSGASVSLAEKTAVKAAFSVASASVEDFRETSVVTLTTVDVGVLANLVSSGSIPSWNGVVYVNDLNASSSNRRGIRLKNGASLPSGGLTFVTPNPVYIQGDFNHSTATGWTWQPAAVAGDAINIYSNNWNDANASLSVSNRTATPTYIDTALLGGNVPTSIGSGSGSYSGGVENFPRFHENWSGVTFTYRGSMVCLYNSSQAVGAWSSASYNPPKRDWGFDTNFQTKAPPGTLIVNNYAKERWY